MLRGAAVAAGFGLCGLALATPVATRSSHSPAEDDLQALLDRTSASVPFDPQLAAVACPVERGPVKEGSDATRAKVSTAVTATTLSYLRARPKPSSYPTSTRLAPTEDRTWQVTASLTQYKLEADGDIHLVLKDSLGHRMIAEIPYGACVPSSSRWKTAIAAARSAFVARMHTTTSWHYVSQRVTVRGLGLFDPPHGQTGAAPNGIELHPVVYIRFG
jgi:hypothetical protein